MYIESGQNLKLRKSQKPDAIAYVLRPVHTLAGVPKEQKSSAARMVQNDALQAAKPDQNSTKAVQEPVEPPIAPDLYRDNRAGQQRRVVEPSCHPRQMFQR